MSRAHVSRITSRFRKTRDVVKVGDPKHRGPVPKMTESMAQRIVDMIIDSPEDMLQEHHQAFCNETGLGMHVSQFCRAVKDLDFTRKKLRSYARDRDAARSAAFKAGLIRDGISADMLFFLDETAKDRNALKRGWGYALRGRKPIDSMGHLPRTYRCSSLCGFDVKGFVNWYTIRGTFNRSKFLEASEAMVVGLPLHAASHRWYHPPLLYATACCCLSWCCPLGV